MPAPDGEFRVVFRIYGPGAKILDQELENAGWRKRNDPVGPGRNLPGRWCRVAVALGGRF